MLKDTVNLIHSDPFTLAEHFVHETTCSVFLTGKAGTGKTTFLRAVKEKTKKQCVVLAPTGVAAINAGGTTIHSFFNLPFSPFVPLRPHEHSYAASGQLALLQNMKVDQEKRKLFRELELLIIDEVSMVRCDVVDAIDTILRFFRRKPYLPFGGVQVVFIGDLYQLPPVMPDQDWEILKSFYGSAYFFDAYALKNSNFINLELTRVYRQSDPHFISLLNNIRQNTITSEDLALLSARLQRGIVIEALEGYITLTTHNYAADKINAAALERLEGELFSIDGSVEGDFPERSYPTDKVLALKVGAQVMFLKNDTEKIRRYYNGKVGKVTDIRDGVIKVNIDDNVDIEVQKETWRNVRYTFNPGISQIEEEVVGTFTQYPLRLAWAVTIHKSQGLTFDKVVVDAERSFAPGQVYVALSRCTSLEGIILYSSISPESIRNDPTIVMFCQQQKTPEQLQSMLQLEQHRAIVRTVQESYDFSLLQEEVETFVNAVSKRKTMVTTDIALYFESAQYNLNKLADIGIRFQHQLSELFQHHDINAMKVRVDAANDYFNKALDEQLINPLEESRTIMKQKKLTKRMDKRYNALLSFIDEYKKLLAKSALLMKDIDKSTD